MIDLHLRLAATPALMLALGLAACAGPGRDPVPGLLGFGTPAVSAYVPEGRAASLQTMRASCEGVPLADPSETQGLPAACGQLHRTLRNQPGNAVR